MKNTVGNSWKRQVNTATIYKYVELCDMIPLEYLNRKQELPLV